MTSFSLQSPRERRLSLYLTLALAIPLAVGFLPTAQRFGRLLLDALRVSPTPFWDPFFFPAMALLFYLSIPRKIGGERQHPRSLLISAIFPILVALAYGAILPGASFVDKIQHPSARLSLLWYVVLAPVGEEWLFRGWFYSLINRFWPNERMTATFPFPVAVWMSALAFSLWHTQNFGIGPSAGVYLQLTYTFVMGMWFGYLRWKSGAVWLGIITHCLVNLAANLI